MGQPLSCDRKERQMAYGRIVNIEYHSEEDYEIALKKWIEWFPHNTSDALSRNTQNVQALAKSRFRVGRQCRR